MTECIFLQEKTGYSGHFGAVEDVDLDGIAVRYLGGDTAKSPSAGPHVISARAIRGTEKA